MRGRNMRIVVLDGYTLNPGDLSWGDLESLGDFEIFDRTPAELTLDRAKDAEILLTNKTVLDAEILGRLPRLQYIGVLATGYNVVDIQAARGRGIPVCNIPTYGTRSVAQMVFAHILHITQRVHYHADTVKAGRWSSSVDFCYWDFPLVELDGLTMGIVGYGRIGKTTAALARAFGMHVLAHDEYVRASGESGVEFVSVEKLFSESDVVSLHCPLLPETEKIVNAGRLKLMKKGAILINTSRGPLVDEQALAEALNDERIAGAGVDVVSTEPIQDNNPLLSAKNCYITPHIAWATISARSRLMNTAIENVRAFLDGEPQNVV